jgi:hypothetical protein
MSKIVDCEGPMAAGRDTGQEPVTPITREAEIEHLHWYLFARQLCRGHDVLDVGSGARDGAMLLRQVARTVVRVETSPDEPPDIPLPEGSVDLVVALDMVELIGGHDRFLQRVRRVLRPGGQLIVRVPRLDAASPEGTSLTPRGMSGLVRDELLALLNDTFGHVRLYAQRLMLGSVIVAEATGGEAQPLVRVEPRGATGSEMTSGLPRATSLAIVASDRPVDATVGSVYIEPGRLEAMIERIRVAENKANDLASQVEWFREELAHRDDALANARHEAEDWHDQLVQRNEEVRSAKAAREAVLMSVSWRVTEPLRRIGHIVAQRRIGRRLGDALAFEAGQHSVTGRRAPIAMFAPRPIPSGDGRDQSPPGGRGRLICMSHVLPFPPRAGNEYRIHRMLTWLAAQGWDVLLLVCLPENEPLTSHQLVEAAQPYPNLVVCQRDGTLHYRLRDGGAMVEELRGRRPRAFAPMLQEWIHASPAEGELSSLMQTFCPDVFIELLLDLDATFQPSVLLAEYIFMTRPFALLRPELFKVVDTHDVFSTRQTKVAQYGIENSLALAPRLEAELLDRADLLIAMHEADADSVRTLAPRRPAISVGVDFPVSEHVTPPASRPIVLLVASDNPMNVKGLDDFLCFAWPLVREALPQAELRVVGRVGRAVDPAVPGVHVLGRVENLDTAYAEARVVINPAIAGTGLKIKTVEALAHLRPIVLWPSGVDGLGPELRALCRVVRNWFDFSRQVIDLASRPDGAHNLVERTSELARQFAPGVVYAPLDAALDAGLAERPAPAGGGERRR